MARAWINEDGTGVRLGLSFREAAALEALLCRVGPGTHEQIDLATMLLWSALNSVREAVIEEDRTLWPTDFEPFTKRSSDLVDEEAGD